MDLLIKFLSEAKLTKLRLNLAKNKKLRSNDFKKMLKPIAAQKELTCLELNLNDTNVELSEVVGLVDVVKTKKNLEELSLRISHIKMNLKDLKAVLKPIRDIHRPSDLKLDVRIKDKNNLNMLKSFSHLAGLS